MTDPLPGPTPRLLTVRVGRPSVLAHTQKGEAVQSGIVKHAVAGGVLELSEVNLSGDEQADLTVHGGAEKAVYAYSADHFADWAAEFERDEVGFDRKVDSGTFGENLTVAGVDERDVCIGDEWTWGDAVLQVVQPRWPCFKLTLHTQVRDIGARMRRSGRTGWYFRVLTPGTVPVDGSLQLTRRHPAGVTVHDAHLAALDRHREDPALIDRVLAVDALATEWRLQLGG